MRAVAALVAPLALAGCVGTRAVAQGPGADSIGYVTGDGSVKLFAAAGRPHVSFSGRLLDGSPFQVAALRGRVVVVNFWAGWCAPCQAEAPALVQAEHDTRARGVSFIGIDIRDSVANALAFQRTHGIDYPSLSDPAALIALRFKVPPAAVPSTVVLDRAGREAVRFIGPVRYLALVAAIDAVSAQR